MKRVISLVCVLSFALLLASSAMADEPKIPTRIPQRVPQKVQTQGDFLRLDKLKLEKPKIKFPYIELSELFCRDGSYLVTSVDDDVNYDFQNKCIQYKINDDSIKGVYLCAASVPLSKIKCPEGSEISVNTPYWLNSASFYSCIKKDGPFSKIECMENWGVFYGNENDSPKATDANPNSCIKSGIYDGPINGSCSALNDKDLGSGWFCCEQMGWAFGCDYKPEISPHGHDPINQYNYNNCANNLVNLKTDFPNVSCCALK